MDFDVVDVVAPLCCDELFVPIDLLVDDVEVNGDGVVDLLPLQLQPSSTIITI